jgi:hypothetical protein
VVLEELGNYINGEWMSGYTSIENINPSDTRDVINLCSQGSAEEAIAIANDTIFGLSAGICTTSLKYSRAFRRQADAGVQMANLPTAGLDYHAPFGGRKNRHTAPKSRASTLSNAIRC